MPMVSYQTFTALAFEVASEKGASYDGITDGGEFIQDIATAWQSNKGQLKQMTEAQARNWLEDRVQS